jgi:hypothetical protein
VSSNGLAAERGKRLEPEGREGYRLISLPITRPTPNATSRLMTGRSSICCLHGGDTLAAATARLVRGVVPHLARPVGRTPHSGAGTSPSRLDFVGGGISEGADERADVLAQRVKARLERVEFLFQVSVGGGHVSSSVSGVGNDQIIRPQKPARASRRRSALVKNSASV